MAFVADTVLDQAVDYIDNECDKLYVLNANCTTWAAATAAAVGYKATPTISDPADASPNGRMVTVSSISGGSITASGTASHVALVDDAASVLLVCQSLSSTQAVTSGNQFNLTAFNVTLPDAS